MRWYSMGNGPLRALKVLLESPLDFDPETYLTRTFGCDQLANKAGLVALAQSYNQQRRRLFPKVSGVAQALRHSAKFSEEDYLSGASPLKFEIARLSGTNAQVDVGLCAKVCDSVNIQIDRMLESFGIAQCAGRRFDANNLSEFVQFYALSEALFLALTEVGSVSASGSDFLVRPADSSAIEELHRKWFANYWEASSSAASIACIDYLPKGSDKSPMFPGMVKLFGKLFRDKIFSIPAEGVSKKLQRLESMSWVSRLSELVALCLWCQLKNDMECAPHSLLQVCGISREHVSTLERVVAGYSQPDRIFAFSRLGVAVVAPTLTIQLRSVLSDIANELSENQLNSFLGDFFEKDYLYGYFAREEMRDSYRVHPGILAHEIEDVALKPDVDLIVEDTQRSWYYFIQVKYIRIGGKAYLQGDLEHVLSGKLMYGARQIGDAKLAMDSGTLKDALVSRGIAGASGENSAFLLVHNIPNFDFCLFPQGVVSYEWNTLRNLFKGGEMIYGHTKEGTELWRNEEPLPLESPDAVIAALMKNSPASSVGGAMSLFYSDNIRIGLPAGEKVVWAQGLGL